HVRPITSIVQFKRGDHICIFYRDENSLIQTLAHYLAVGLLHGERCFCVQKKHVIPKLLEALEALGIDVGRETRRGALDVHTDQEFYFSTGHFDPQALMDSLEKSIQVALAQGFNGMRTAGELSWAMTGSNGDPHLLCDQVAGYEEMVARSF